MSLKEIASGAKSSKSSLHFYCNECCTHTQRSKWLGLNPGKGSMIIGLRVEMRQPTRTVFHLAFKVERYINQLSLFAQFGKIWVVPGPPPKHLTGTQEMDIQTFIEKVVNYAGQGIMIELEPKLVADLRSLLDEWKQIK